MATSLDTRSQSTIVGNIAAGMQSRVNSFLNFAVGSVLLAISEGVTGVALWLQRVNQQILGLTRAATSDGDDLDSWMADFKLGRLGASASTGTVTFGLFAAKTSATVIPVGAQVKTGDGSLVFTVYADPTNGAYNATLGGYVLGAGALSIDVPVLCGTAGTVGNVTAGAISVIASQVPADTVSNRAAFTSGLDPESDDDFRTRFWDYMASLSLGTEGAYRFAIRSIQQGLRVQYSSAPGLVTIYVDDGSGAPPLSLVQQCQAVCDAVRAGGTQVAVFGATTLPANVYMIVTVDQDAGYDPNATAAAVINALSVYINGIPEGGTLAWARLESIAFATSPGVIDVSSVLLNGGTANLIAGPGQTIKANNLVVNPAT